MHSHEERSPDITIIGCVQADIIVRSVTDLPEPGSTMLCEEAAVRAGGAGANSALAAAEIGMMVRLVGCIGDDSLGGLMRHELRCAGLADDLIEMPGANTGLTVALQSPVRDRTFLTFLGVNALWEAEMIPGEALTCGSLLLCDYFVAPRLRGHASHRLLRTARERGARTFFDTTWDPAGFPRATRDEVYGLLPLVDVLLPNELEVCALADQPGDPIGAARTLQQISGNWVVVKLGADGCVAIGPDHTEIAVPAPRVDVLDTTGAGDVFNAGLINALAAEASWPEAMTQATRLASEIVARPSDDRQRVRLAEMPQ